MLIDTAGATDLDQAMQLLQLLMAGGCACHVLCESLCACVAHSPYARRAPPSTALVLRFLEICASQSIDGAHPLRFDGSIA
jgi:hypothetical protein